jgi:hypothetical protein
MCAGASARRRFSWTGGSGSCFWNRQMKLRSAAGRQRNLLFCGAFDVRRKQETFLFSCMSVLLLVDAGNENVYNDIEIERGRRLQRNQEDMVWNMKRI